jgi:hypothetical protein
MLTGRALSGRKQLYERGIRNLPSLAALNGIMLVITV